MRKFLILLAILLFCFFMYFTVTNIQASVMFNFANGEHTLNMALYTSIVLFVGIFIGMLLVFQKYLTQKDAVNAYKRQLEKSSVTSSSNSSKVEVLEAKIQTLEKALKNALGKN